MEPVQDTTLTPSAQWLEFETFLLQHPDILQSKRRGNMDKLYSDAVLAYGDRVPHKETLRNIVTFYRRFCNVDRVYNTPNYIPKHKRVP
jgi:hypothetical protein